MLKRASSLNKDKEFDYVFKHGQASYNKIIGIKAVANRLQHSRFGIITGVKVSKKAVERNKIKRKIKHIIGQQIINIKPSFDILIISLPTILNKSYHEVEQSINEHFKKLGLYKK